MPIPDQLTFKQIDVLATEFGPCSHCGAHPGFPCRLWSKYLQRYDGLTAHVHSPRMRAWLKSLHDPIRPR